MANYTLRTHDTGPPIGVPLTDSSGPPGIDLTTASSVLYSLKGVTAPLITGTCVIGQVAATATLSTSTTITAVTPTTGYANGATVYAPALFPTGTTILSGAGTSTVVLSKSALTSGSAQAFIINIGLVYIPLNSGGLPAGFTTADTYSGEHEIHWANGTKQTVPNAKANDYTIEVDSDEDNA